MELLTRNLSVSIHGERLLNKQIIHAGGYSYMIIQGLWLLAVDGLLVRTLTYLYGVRYYEQQRERGRGCYVTAVLVRCTRTCNIRTNTSSMVRR